ncbi:MAG: hypothetical protein ACFFBD_22900 [Candidatus Hodarchaeota archaeon]
MKYEIKSYQEEFLDDQVRIGTAVLSQWRFAGQTPKEQLKQTYSQQEFTPETRLYAFHEGKMAGFVTSYVLEEEGVKKARIEIPIVTKGHEEARNALFEEATKVLKEKGVKILRTRAGEYWTGTTQLAEAFGFKYTSVLARESRKRINEIKISIDPVDVNSYDPKKEFNQLVKLVMKQFNVPEETAKPVAERYNDWKIGEAKSPFGFPQTLIFHEIIMKEGEIVGRVLGLQAEQYGQNVVLLGALYVKDNDEKIRGQLIAAAVRETKKMGLKELLVQIGAEGEESYTPYGFEFSTKLGFYEKEI